MPCWAGTSATLFHQMADVGFLFSGLAATALSDRATADARAKEPYGTARGISADKHNGATDLLHRRDRLCDSWRRSVDALIWRAAPRFAPSIRLTGREWQARSGQLLYRNARTTLIGDVLVRFSKSGDFELTFSKGPGSYTSGDPAGRILCRSERRPGADRLVGARRSCAGAIAWLVGAAREVNSRARSNEPSVAYTPLSRSRSELFFFIFDQSVGRERDLYTCF